MNQSDLPTIRQLAKNGAFSATNHAYSQMLGRSITYDDVKNILTSTTNQIIECQSPSQAIGKQHKDERVLVYDPCSSKDVIVVFVVLLVPVPDLRIVTVEKVDYTKWEKNDGSIPSLTRK